jgi:cation:H+ antiporter
MILFNLLLFLVSLVVLTKSASYSIRYSHKLAVAFRLPEFLVSFLIIAVISCFPEGSISVIAALEGTPEFGLGTLLGSNVADLTLVFGIVALFSSTGIRVRSTILQKDIYYLLLLLLPVILGWEGEFSRFDGIVLILAGLFFFFSLSLQGHRVGNISLHPKHKNTWKNGIFLLLSLVFLLLSAYYTVEFGTRFASEIGLPVILISLTIVSLGTCLPELLFSIKAVKENHDGLALGDILGTVITDATIILGLVCLISPFQFNPVAIYITGTAMVLAALAVILFFKAGTLLTKREGILMIVLYILYLIAEFIGNRII